MYPVRAVVLFGLEIVSGTEMLQKMGGDIRHTLIGEFCVRHDNVVAIIIIRLDVFVVVMLCQTRISKLKLSCTGWPAIQNEQVTHIRYKTNRDIGRLLRWHLRGHICKQWAAKTLNISALGFLGGLLPSCSFPLEGGRNLLILTVRRE